VTPIRSGLRSEVKYLRELLNTVCNGWCRTRKVAVGVDRDDTPRRIEVMLDRLRLRFGTPLIKATWTKYHYLGLCLSHSRPRNGARWDTCDTQHLLASSSFDHFGNPVSACEWGRQPLGEENFRPAPASDSRTYDFDASQHFMNYPVSLGGAVEGIGKLMH